MSTERGKVDGEIVEAFEEAMEALRLLDELRNVYQSRNKNTFTSQTTENRVTEEKHKKEAVSKKKRRKRISIERLAQMKEEINDMKDKMNCKVCLETKINRAFLPCRHLTCCDTCAQKLRDCPICRTKIIALVKVK